MKKVINKCIVLECNKKATHKKMCKYHYDKIRLHGSLDYLYLKDKDNYKENNLNVLKSSHKLYSTYRSMITRCYNTNSKVYKNYGYRNIKVCDNWLGPNGFNQFLLDMKERPSGYTLDRINNNQNYSKENCKWSNKYEQANNRRNNNLYYNGIHYCNRDKTFIARVRVNKKYITLGRNKDYEKCIELRKNWEKLNLQCP